MGGRGRAVRLTGVDEGNVGIVSLVGACELPKRSGTLSALLHLAT